MHAHPVRPEMTALSGSPIATAHTARDSDLCATLTEKAGIMHRERLPL